MDGSFVDRLDAGRQLAQSLENFQGSNGIVVGLARGGVVVGYPVARHLHLPLQALAVRKVGAPRNPELAIGAVSETGIRWIDHHLVRVTGTTAAYLEGEVATQVEEARRRQREYATGPGLEMLRGRTAIVVDDGIATGASALVAIRSVRDLGAAEVVLATPTAAPQALYLLRPQADHVVALLTPDPFQSVGLYYENFSQTTDAEVIHYLHAAAEARETE